MNGTLRVGSCPASRPVPYWDTLPAGVYSCVPGGLVRDAPWTGGPLPSRNRSLHPTARLDGVSTTLPGMPPATFFAQRRGPSDRAPTLPTTGRRRSVSMRHSLDNRMGPSSRASDGDSRGSRAEGKAHSCVTWLVQRNVDSGAGSALAVD